MGSDLLGFLLERAGEDEPAFVRESGEEMSYGSLALAVRAVSDMLAEARAPAGGRDLERRAIGIAVADQAGALVATLAALGVGAAAVLLDLASGEQAALEAAARAEVAAVVVGSLEDDTLRVMRGQSARPLEEAVALVLPTLGASGEPRAVMLSASGVEADVEAMANLLSLHPRSRTPLLAPLSSGSVIGQALATLRSGGALLGLGALGGRDRAGQALGAMARLGANGLLSTPSSLYALARAAIARPIDLRPRLAFVASSGAPLVAETAALLGEAFPGARRINHYRITEASSVSAISDEDPRFEIGSVGKPLAGASVRVVGADGATLRPGERGEIEVRAPSQMLGYLDDAEATARAIASGWLRTGDLGRLDPDGYLFLDGRVDGLVKVAGERVSLDKLAERLRAIDGVGEACVIAAADPALEARLVAFVEPREGAPEDLAERVRAFAAARLKPAWRPAKVVELSRLPRAGGGIDRQALRRMVEPT